MQLGDAFVTVLSLRKGWWLAGFVLAFLACATVVYAAPPPPHLFYGTVKLSGQNVPDGTWVFAYVMDGDTRVMCGHTQTFTYLEDSVYALNVKGDDPETPEKDGAHPGDTVYFLIGEEPNQVLANETGIWHSTDSTNLNLTGTAIPTPTPTATYTPTPVATATPTATPTRVRVFLPLIYKAYPAAGRFVVTTFQEGLNGYVGCVDTFLDQWNPTSVHGNELKMAVRSYEVRHALIRFDLSSIPTNVLVHSARLELYVSERTNANPISVAAYRVNRVWSEDVATWITATTGVTWAIPGCAGPSDREPSPVVTRTLSTTEAWYTWDITSLARGWIQSPASNAGVLLLAPAGQGAVEYKLLSSEWPVQGLRPKLTVAYWIVR